MLARSTTGRELFSAVHIGTPGSRRASIAPTLRKTTRNLVPLSFSTCSAEARKPWPPRPRVDSTAKQKMIAKWIVDQIARDFPVIGYATEKESYD